MYYHLLYIFAEQERNDKKLVRRKRGWWRWRAIGDGIVKAVEVVTAPVRCVLDAFSCMWEGRSSSKGTNYVFASCVL